MGPQGSRPALPCVASGWLCTAEQSYLQTTADYQSCKQEEGQSWRDESLLCSENKGYIDNLERMGHPVTLALLAKEEKERTATEVGSNGQVETEAGGSKLARVARERVRAVSKGGVEAIGNFDIISPLADYSYCIEQCVHYAPSTRNQNAVPQIVCLYIDAEEHELGDLGEPANYKAALLDLESDKWLKCYECGNAIHERQRNLGLS
ncbi:hypothetical protein Tco_0401773 [Tanacetum coccineum]